jgi:drug/metabolite transporter (DMT)-like permease
MLKKVRAEAFVVFGAIAFAFNGIISKLVLTSGLSAWHLTQLRCTGAFIVLFLYVFIGNRSSLRTTVKELPWLAAYGIVGFALVQFGYFVAITRLHVGIALIIEFTAPIWILFYIRFIRKKHVPKLMWISIAMGFCGLLLVARVWQGMTLDGIGVMAALLDAFALAAYFLLGEKLVVNRTTDTLTVYGLGFASLAWGLTSPVWSFPYSVFTQKINLLGRFEATNVPGWVLILWIVIAGTIIPYLAVLHGLRELSASTSSVIGMLEPVVAGAFAWWWLRETFTIIQLIGGVIVIAGILMADRARLAVH